MACNRGIEGGHTHAQLKLGAKPLPQPSACGDTGEHAAEGRSGLGCCGGTHGLHMGTALYDPRGEGGRPRLLLLLLPRAARLLSRPCPAEVGARTLRSSRIDPHPQSHAPGLCVHPFPSPFYSPGCHRVAAAFPRPCRAHRRLLLCRGSSPQLCAKQVGSARDASCCYCSGRGGGMPGSGHGRT